MGYLSKRLVKPRQIYLASHLCWGFAVLTTPALTLLPFSKGFSRKIRKVLVFGEKIKAKPAVQGKTGKEWVSGSGHHIFAWAERTEAWGEMGLSWNTAPILATWVPLTSYLISLGLSFWICEMRIILVPWTVCWENINKKAHQASKCLLCSRISICLSLALLRWILCFNEAGCFD